LEGGEHGDEEHAEECHADDRAEARVALRSRGLLVDVDAPSQPATAATAITMAAENDPPRPERLSQCRLGETVPAEWTM